MISIIVSDASPLINLAAIGKLDLLPKLYGKICIPRAVYDEITVRGAGQPGDAEIRSADWVDVKECQNTALISELLLEIDAGEAEAISLALELNCDWLIMDERMGRSKAKENGLKLIGLIGILIEAKRRQYIGNVSILMDALIKNNFWISKELYEDIRKIVNE